MDLINQYFKKMLDHIQVLELENSNLKKNQNGEIDNLKKEFTSLTERHKELKEAFLESENQVKELTRQNEELIQKEKEFSEQIKNTFEQQFGFVNQNLTDQMSTPKKSPNNLENESQKMKYLKAKKVPKKLVLKNMYESESDSDDSKQNHDLINNTSVDRSDDDSINVMKKLIGDDLWNCLETNVNTDHQHKSSQTNPTVNVKKPDDDLLLLSNMFGAYLAKLDNQDKAVSQEKANNLLHSRVGRNKK
jgi:hypothetical protein